MRGFLRNLAADAKHVVKGNVSPNIAANSAIDMNRWYVRAGEKFGGAQHAQNLRQSASRRAAAKSDYDTAKAQTKSNLSEQRSTMESITDVNSPEYNAVRETIKNLEGEMLGHKTAYQQALRSGNATRWDQAGQAWDMYNAGTAGQRAIKYGATAAAYFGAAGVGRALTGGGVTYNSNGERDIMGVPLF